MSLHFIISPHLIVFEFTISFPLTSPFPPTSPFSRLEPALARVRAPPPSRSGENGEACPPPPLHVHVETGMRSDAGGPSAYALPGPRTAPYGSAQRQRMVDTIVWHLIRKRHYGLLDVWTTFIFGLATF